MFHNLKNNPKMWRYLANFWTVVFYIFIIIDFIKNNALDKFLGPLAAIYIATLAIYAGEKEFERWHELYKGRHPGEVFIILWTILMTGLFAADFIMQKHYKMPGEITAVYIAVLGVLAITRKSKSFFAKKGGK